MRSNDRRFPILGFLFLSLVNCGILGFSPGSAIAQATKPNRAEPRLPGAVEKAPEWLKDAPFDVAKFFEMPPAAQNAAPLYLEALFEFGTELEPIYPPELRQRSAAISQRSTRAMSLYQSWDHDPEKADRAAIDAMLAEYKDAFRKLDLAQKRPRCVFAIGLSLDAPVTHAQVARNAIRILLMHASRSLDRDEFEPALGDIGKMLRLSRDLRPRGTFICQLVSVAIDATVCMSGVKLFLAYPKLRAEHCDRLIQLLADHEALAIEPFLEGIQGEYVCSRWTLRTFSDRVETTIDADGHAVETKLDERGIRQEINKLLSENNLNRPEIATLLLTNPATLLKDRQSFDDCLKTMLAAKPTYADRVRQSKLLEKTHLDGRPPCLFKLLCPNYPESALVASRDLVYLRTAQCLIALRRWQLTHTAAPTDLAEVCRAAKMPGVPVDPFSGSALKLAIIDGKPAVYSVGSDGVDDGGRKDAELGKKPSGDFVFRLPKRK